MVSGRETAFMFTGLSESPWRPSRSSLIAASLFLAEGASYFRGCRWSRRNSIRRRGRRRAVPLDDGQSGCRLAEILQSHVADSALPDAGPHTGRASSGESNIQVKRTRPRPEQSRSRGKISRSGS